jgi:hypothetical protein
MASRRKNRRINTGKSSITIKDYTIEDMLDNMLTKNMFEQKINILNYIRECLTYEREANVFTEQEKRSLKEKMFEILQSMNFEQENLFKRKLLTEKKK